MDEGFTEQSAREQVLMMMVVMTTRALDHIPAIVRTQSKYRGVIARRQYSEMKKTHNDALFEEFLKEKEDLERKQKLEAHEQEQREKMEADAAEAERERLRREAEEAAQLKKMQEEKERNEAAILIQSIWRGYNDRLEYTKQHNSGKSSPSPSSSYPAIAIQCCYRRYVAVLIKEEVLVISLHGINA